MREAGALSASVVSLPFNRTHATHERCSFKLNVWDVGGQKSLRSYWRNYFESTDGLVCFSRGQASTWHFETD